MAAVVRRRGFLYGASDDGGREEVVEFLLKPSLQGLHNIVQLLDLVAQGAHIGLHSQRGLRPVLAA